VGHTVLSLGPDGTIGPPVDEWSMTTFTPHRPAVVAQPALATGGTTATRAERASVASCQARTGPSHTLRTPTTHRFA